MRKLTSFLADSDFVDIQKIYDLNLEAFPDEERIPNEKLFEIAERCKAKILAFYDQDIFIGFAIGSYSSQFGIYYIWFFAIQKEYRSLGYGSLAIEAIQERHPRAQIVIEIEVLDPLSDNYMERLRRFEFYRRNGFEKSVWGVSYFGADFQIISKPAPFKKEEYETFWKALWADREAPLLYRLKDFSI